MNIYIPSEVLWGIGAFLLITFVNLMGYLSGYDRGVKDTEERWTEAVSRR